MEIRRAVTQGQQPETRAVWSIRKLIGPTKNTYEPSHTRYWAYKAFNIPRRSGHYRVPTLVATPGLPGVHPLAILFQL